MPELSDELIGNNLTAQSVHPTDQVYLVEEMSTAEELGDGSNLPITFQDEKSSSFPFGTLQSDLTALYDQSSTGGLNEGAAHTTDSIEILLANLTEDNANSLPSESGAFSQLNTFDANAVASENSSEPAVAEDLANGNSSSDTKVDALEADMVSEDELPDPTVLKVSSRIMILFDFCLGYVDDGSWKRDGDISIPVAPEHVNLSQHMYIFMYIRVYPKL